MCLDSGKEQVLQCAQTLLGILAEQQQEDIDHVNEIRCLAEQLNLDSSVQRAKKSVRGSRMFERTGGRKTAREHAGSL